MSIITMNNLNKEFKLKLKNPGLKGSLTSIINPQYESIKAVTNLNLDVDEGESIAFIGPNGAGKSTTIKMLTGILHPTSGDMNVMGYDPRKERKKLAYHIGTVFGQKSQLWFHLPPLDSFSLLGKIYEMDDHRIKKRIDELTEIFEIENLMKTPVRKMSLGQRIRCEIAASIIHEPKIIFLDEPTIGLDVIVKQNIRKLIKTINKESNTTIFLTSHDAGDIEELCNRVVIINHGEVVTDESVKDLKRNYLKNKVIHLKYLEPVHVHIPGIEVLKQKGSAVKVEVDTETIEVEEAVHQLMKLGKVVDITIDDPPLEEVIAMIYQKRKEET